MKKKTDFSAKPYNRCLTCHHREEGRCNGPRTSAMELERWCEFMRDMKEANGLTNAYVAEKSAVSIKRIEQLMALKCDQDIMRETARRIENAIIGSVSQYPCYLAFEESSPNETKKLEEAQKKIDYLLKQVDRLRGEIDYLRLENDRKSRIIDRFLER